MEVSDAKVDRVEERRAAAVDRRAVERDAKRVHDIAPNTMVSPTVADCARLSMPPAPASVRMLSDTANGAGVVEGRHVPAEEILIVRELVVHASDRLPRLAVGRLGMI